MSYLRRKDAREKEEEGTERNSLSIHPSTGTSSSSLKMSHSVGHSHKPSTGTSGMMRSTSNVQSRPPTAAVTPVDKGVSIESSVRKFRIFEALRSGDTASISKAIRDTHSSRTSIDGGSAAAAVDGTSILNLAVQCAEQPVVEYVLSDGAGTIDINARDKDGNTALHIAAQQGRGPIVRLLLDQPGINDSIANYQGRLPLDLARTPDIFQQLQLSRSLFADIKIKQVQGLVAQGDYERLSEVLEEPRVKTVLDINGGEFASDISTIQSGGTLLHEAARKKDKQLIQVLLLHGADPFRRDRRGKLPQDVTKDDSTRAVLKKSPAAAAAQRGIQEKAVLGNAAQPNSNPGDPLAGKEGREMKGYLKKWTNYRKGYQLRWFVLEDGVMSYYKHQDDSGSACRGAINMRIARLNMDPTEKTKFDIIGKSSVKYNLKANHEIEAKRWFWALNNSIQWTKDQAKEEQEENKRNAELLQQAKAEHSGRSKELSIPGVETTSGTDISRTSTHVSRSRVAFNTTGSVGDEDEGTAYGSYEPSFMGPDVTKRASQGSVLADGEDDDDEYGDGSSDRDAPSSSSKDAFGITAQSARLQLEMLDQVNAALQTEQTRNPALTITDPIAVQAVQTYDSSIRNLKGLVGDLLKISKDRDSYWQHRLEREAEMRRMWEDSMAQVAREQEILEARVGESEEKRKLTKRALREVMEGGVTISRPDSRAEPGSATEVTDALKDVTLNEDGTAVVRRRRSTTVSSFKRKSVLTELTNLSDSESEDDEEFFDAVDAGEVEATKMPPTPLIRQEEKKAELVAVKGIDLSPSFRGYEKGIRQRLKMDADDRPKISLWVIYLFHVI